MPRQNLERLSRDYQRIEQAILLLDQSVREQPSLDQLAARLNLSESRFQRLFSRWAGISPKRFLQFLTVEHAKATLARCRSLLDVTYAAGLSSVSRLHDLFLTCEAVTPGEFRTRGEGVSISYAFHPSIFGECLLAATERGICGLTFIQNNGGREAALEDLRKRWKRAVLVHDTAATLPLAERIFSPGVDHRRPLYVFLKGTNFQIKVWEALLRIPPGSVLSYRDLAGHLGMPGNSRAVAGAVARNPVQFVIPCHRVIRSIGAFGGYHGGPARKKAMLAWEAARQEGRLGGCRRRRPLTSGGAAGNLTALLAARQAASGLGRLERGRRPRQPEAPPAAEGDRARRLDSSEERQNAKRGDRPPGRDGAVSDLRAHPQAGGAGRDPGLRGAAEPA